MARASGVPLGIRCAELFPVTDGSCRWEPDWVEAQSVFLEQGMEWGWGGAWFSRGFRWMTSNLLGREVDPVSG